jgi:hypothetical protein
MRYMVYEMFRNGNGSGWGTTNLDKAIKLAYGRWKEREEFRSNVWIKEEGFYGKTLYTPRQLTYYFKKHILDYI